jgi:hypothetical protein
MDLTELLQKLFEGNNPLFLLLAFFLFKDQILSLFKVKPKPADPSPNPDPTPSPNPAPVVPPEQHPVVAIVKELLPVLIPILIEQLTEDRDES